MLAGNWGSRGTRPLKNFRLLQGREVTRVELTRQPDQPDRPPALSIFPTFSLKERDDCEDV